ncbi:MAG: carbohydrate kinase family protein [Pseudomonadota bacterium]
MRGAIVCAGNWIVDIVHVIDRWPEKSQLVTIAREVEGIGGGAANVLLALDAFGVDVPLFAMGLVGTDPHGATCRAALAGSRADLRWLVSTPKAMTAHTHVMTLPGDSRTFFYHPGCNDLLSEADLPVEAAAQAGAGLFYLGYLNLLGALDALQDGQTAAARVLARARAAGMVTCVDLVSKAGPEFAAVVAASLPQIDYLFLNEVEAALATGLAITGPADQAGIAAAAQALLGAGVQRAVILHTPALGLWAARDGVVIRAPDPAAVIVNPLGAGDAFCAGVIWGIHQGWTPERALTLGHHAAAECLKGETATGSIPDLNTLLTGL